MRDGEIKIENADMSNENIHLIHLINNIHTKNCNAIMEMEN